MIMEMEIIIYPEQVENITTIMAIIMAAILIEVAVVRSTMEIIKITIIMVTGDEANTHIIKICEREIMRIMWLTHVMLTSL